MTIEDPAVRRTGRTTKQMREAPQGATFVWCTNGTAYPRALAAQLGRRDLDVVPLDWLDWLHGSKHRGRPGPFVVDHAVALTDEQRRDLGLTVDNDRAGRPGPFVVDHAVALTDEQRRDLGLTVDNDRAG